MGYTKAAPRNQLDRPINRCAVAYVLEDPMTAMLDKALDELAKLSPQDDAPIG